MTALARPLPSRTTAVPLVGGNMPFARAGVIVSAAVPGALLVWDALHHELGADPVNFAIHTTGRLAVIFFLVSLAVTPVRKIADAAWLIQFRRALGLAAFYYAAAHLAIYFWFTRSHDVGKTF